MTLNVAIVGAGYIARYHARAVHAAGDSVVRVVSRTMDSARTIAGEIGAGAAGTRIDELTGDEDVDAVVLAQPNALHAPHAVACLDAGKHVLVEKPLAPNAGDARRVVERAREVERVLMTGHMWRYDPEARWLREELDSGRIGSVIRTEGYGVHERWGPGGWFVDRALSGGGALVDMGVHAIDTARFLLGDPQPVEVYARIGTFFGDYEVDDDAHLVVAWDNGAYSVIQSGWWQPKAPGVEAATCLWGKEGYASLFPTRLELPGKDDPLETIEPEGMPSRSEHCDQLIYDRQYAAFAERVRGSQSTHRREAGSAEPGLIAVTVVDAAYESSRTKRIVSLRS